MGNSHAMWDHTVLAATRQRWESCLLPQPKQVLDLATPEGMQGWVDLCYVKVDRPGIEPATCKSQVERPTIVPTRTLFLSVTIQCFVKMAKRGIMLAWLSVLRAWSGSRDSLLDFNHIFGMVEARHFKFGVMIDPDE